MVYVPGAAYRGGSYGKSGTVYTSRQEFREAPRVSFSSADLRRSEGLSRELGDRLLAAFRAKGLLVHEFKPIREKIIRGRRTYVPAVLRYNSVLSQALLEVCNLANSEDLRLIQTQTFRQSVAEAIVEAVLAYYGFEAGSASQVAAAR
jgi:N-acetylmuramoyl-L-alanine amidase